VNIYRARPVIVVDGAVRQKIMTPYQTADKIAADAGVTLHDEDTTDIAPSNDIVADGAGVEMVITRATPFMLNLYGKQTVAYTQEKTVGAMLAAKKITLGESDTLSVNKNAPITPNMNIEIWRNGKQTVTEEKEIAFDTKKIQDVDKPVGYKEVQTQGEPGTRDVTYEIEMKNGQEVGRKEIQSVVIKQPKQQVEVVGAKLTNTFSGDFAGALARLRSCEGSYTSNTGNGYYGAYQYDIQTWGNYMGYPNAAVAPPAVQDQKVWVTYQRRGWSPWPSCSKSQGLQDIYR
jgi:uncharacterized protein YabE (DUF348 family)